MYDLPKNISLPIARQAYPGSWGALLSPTFKASSLAPERMKQLRERAISLSELRDLDLLKKFKKQSDLLAFLHEADPSTEKEIYVVAGDSSMLSSVRPPFYKIFEMSENAIGKLVPMIRIEEWAHALFNTDREARKKVEVHFSDKQKYRYMELIRSFDSSPPNRDTVGEIRERVARLAKQIEKHLLEESVDALNALNDLQALEEVKTDEAA